MGNKVTIELDAVEAHLVLGAIANSQAQANVDAAKLRGEAGEYASIRADVFNRVAIRIVDGLVPEEDPRLVILREQIELGMI